MPNSFAPFVTLPSKRTRLLGLIALLVSVGVGVGTSLAGCSDTTHSAGSSGGTSGGTSGSSGNPDCPPSAAVAGDIVNACGAVDSSAYAALAPKLGSAEGIKYRYGEACDHATTPPAPTWSQLPDHHFDNGTNGKGWEWQVGGPQSASTDVKLDDYASNMGQALHVADDPTSPGVFDLTPYIMGRNTFAERPQLPWVYYGKGDPDVNIVEYQKTSSQLLREPTAIGRCYGHFGWCSNAFVTFPNGMIVTTGSNTARNKNTFQLPPGKVPTAVAVTNSSEFALVTVWDTINLKGQVAVLALAGTCAGCGPDGTKPVYNWWGEWATLHPGLRNLGNIGFIKLLGFVDLPGMMAPIEISASADFVPNLDNQQGWLCAADGKTCRTSAYELPLEDEIMRQSCVSGANAGRYSKSGFAVVISKSERKAIVLDLKPLFAKVQSMYFGTRSDFVLTQNIGQGDNQWPYSFSAAPDFAPEVVKTIELAQPPTSVKTSLEKSNRAWIGTVDGSLHIVDVGGYGNNTAATPAAIAEVGTVQVGKNPTWIAYAKHDWANPLKRNAINHEVIVVSRGTCSIDWVTFAADDRSGTITRTLRDSRLLDPISAEDNDNHGTESYLLTVADYGGKQIAQYRFGPVTYWTNPGQVGNSVAAACQPPNGCATGSNGKDTFEFAGAYPTSGHPFRFTSANVP